MLRRPPDDIDWYVLYADRQERRERLFKWYLLSLLVFASLVLMGLGVGYVYLRGHPDKIPKWASFLTPGRRRVVEPFKPIQRMPLDPVIVESFIKGQIRFSQKDQNGFVTSITHCFLELALPFEPEEEGGEPRKGFRVFRPDPSAEGAGNIQLYCLRNQGTGDKHEFHDVPAEKLPGGSGWRITDEGHVKIRDKLQAKMKVQLTKAHWQH